MDTFWHTLETGLGLDIILWLQTLQNPLFDGVATLFHYLGAFQFFLVLVVLVYWAVDRRLGVRLLFLWLITLGLMDLLKTFFARPRPFAVSDQVIMLVDQSGYGIPSGHTMITLVLWGYMAYWFKVRQVTVGSRFTIFAVVYTLIMGWSRMHLGVHYPQDVAAGLLFGGLILWLAIRYDEAFNRRWARLPITRQLILLLLMIILIAAIGWGVDNLSLAMTLSGILGGAGVGLLWAAQQLSYVPRSGIQWRILNFVGGLILALVIYFGFELLKDLIHNQPGLPLGSVVTFTQFALVGLILTAVWPWLSVRLKLAEQVSTTFPETT